MPHRFTRGNSELATRDKQTSQQASHRTHRLMSRVFIAFQARSISDVYMSCGCQKSPADGNGQSDVTARLSGAVTSPPLQQRTDWHVHALLHASINCYLNLLIITARDTLSYARCVCLNMSQSSIQRGANMSDAELYIGLYMSSTNRCVHARPTCFRCPHHGEHC